EGARDYLLPALFSDESKSTGLAPSQTTALPIPVSGGDPLTAGGSSNDGQNGGQSSPNASGDKPGGGGPVSYKKLRAHEKI
ncbi:hypothetical protein ACQ4LF_23205, partial [Aeromonas salmonicida]